MYNGNRTVWSAIRSVIIRVMNIIGRLRSGTESDDMKSRYELIIIITIFREQMDVTKKISL